jgi:hypothetical protein
MVSGWIGERADNGVFAGLRIYFGERDKTPIDRHRQDDPASLNISGVAAAEATMRRCGLKT